MRGKAFSVPLTLSLLWLAASASTPQSHAAYAYVSIIHNGGFESGLWGWQVIDSGVGDSRTSKLVSHSGNYSLQLELWSTNMMTTDQQVQGVSQSATVENLTGLTVEAWYLTTSCQFPSGVEGQVIVQVENATIAYPTTTTCGEWEHFEANVIANNQSAQGVDLFQRHGSASVVIALELVRSSPSALTQYWSMYWDDVNATAQTLQQTLQQTSAAISIASSNQTTVTSTETSVSTLTIATTQISPATNSVVSPFTVGVWIGGLPMVLIGMLAGGVFTASIMAAATGARRVKGRWFCPKCGFAQPESSVNYCASCGVSIDEMKNHLDRLNHS